MKTAQALLGHSDLGTTLNTYSQALPESQRRAVEKVSGAKSDRVELTKLLKAIGPGDVLIVTRLDRLARSTLDLLAILRRVTEVGAKFKSLKDPWADTTTPHGELMVTILAGLAAC